MEPEESNTDVEVRRSCVFGVVQAGKPLSRAVWTENRELAEDMMSNATDDTPLELWAATFVTRS